MTRDDIPSYTDEFWSEEARAELKGRLSQITNADCREVIEALLELNDPTHLVAALRGTLFGLAKKEQDKRRQS